MRNLKVLNALICFLALILFIQRLNYSEVRQHLLVMGPYFVVIILNTMVSYFLAAVAWRVCINSNQYLSMLNAWLYRQAGETISTLNPANIIAGEGSKILFLSRHNIKKSTALLSIVISRTIMILSVILIFIIVGSSLIGIYLSAHATGLWFEYWTILLAIPLLWVVIRRLQWSHYSFLDQYTWLRALRRPLRFGKIRMARFYRYHKIKLLTAFILTTLHWLIGALEVGIILQAFDIDISLWQMFLVDSGIMVLKSFGAMIPAQIGAEEVANIIMLHAIGLQSDEIWAAFSIIRRLRQLFWLLIGSVIILTLFKRPSS